MFLSGTTGFVHILYPKSKVTGVFDGRSEGVSKYDGKKAFRNHDKCDTLMCLPIKKNLFKQINPSSCCKEASVSLKTVLNYGT